MGEGDTPTSCLSSGSHVLPKSREIWLLGLHTSMWRGVHMLVLNLCTQLDDPSLNNGHYLVFHLYQQDGLVDMGATAWVTATRHPPVNYL